MVAKKPSQEKIHEEVSSRRFPHPKGNLLKSASQQGAERAFQPVNIPQDRTSGCTYRVCPLEPNSIRTPLNPERTPTINF